MDNDALMRRISAATDAKAVSGQSQSGATAPPPAVQNDARERLRQQALQAQQQRVAPNHQPPQNAGATTAAATASPHAPLVPSAAATPVQPVSQPAFAEPHPTHQTAGVTTPIVSQVADSEIPAVNHSEETASQQPMSFIPVKEEDRPTAGNGPRPMRREDRPEAYVVSCNGNMAIVQGDTGCVDTVTGLTWAVGRMLSIIVGKNRIVGMICDIEIMDEKFCTLKFLSCVNIKNMFHDD